MTEAVRRSVFGRIGRRISTCLRRRKRVSTSNDRLVTNGTEAKANGAEKAPDPVVESAEEPTLAVTNEIRSSTPPIRVLDPESEIEGVLSAMEKFRSKQLTYQGRNGETVIVSEVIDSVLNRIRPYTNIGSILVQSDPTIAALAWGGFNLLLQIAGSDAEMTAKIVETLGDIIAYVNIYEPYVGRYRDSETGTGKALYMHLMRLQKEIKEFCTMARNYFEKSTARRIAGAAITPFAVEFGPVLQKITRTRQLIDPAISAAAFEDNSREELLQWLSTVYYQDAHQNEQNRRSENTCNWLLNRSEFIDWRDSEGSSLLWLHGGPGCGKSVLMSKAIDHLQNLPGRSNLSCPVSYFYCTFGDDQTQQPAVILATILRQIVATRQVMPQALSNAFNQHKRGELHGARRGFKDTEAHLIDVLKLPEINTTYIILDGLDECPLNPRGTTRSGWDSRVELMRSLVRLLNKELVPTNVKVLIASRWVHDIINNLQTFPNIAVGGIDTKEDIREYIGTHLKRSIERGYPIKRPAQEAPHLESLIINTLTEKASGMFLWGSLQLVTICNEHTVAAVKGSLEDLPNNCDELYLRILKKLEKHTPRNRMLAKRAIAWVFCATRPLSVAELTEALCVDNSGINQEDKCDGATIQEVCMNLIVVETQGRNDFFRFTHFSVQEFLRNIPNLHLYDIPRELEPSPRFDFSIDINKVHEEILSTCVTYLSLESFTKGPWDSETLYECAGAYNAFIEKHPFLEYAASSWAHHFHSTNAKDTSVVLANNVVRLLGKHNNIELSFQIYWFRTQVDGFPLHATPLHIACYFGLVGPAKRLLASKTHQVDRMDSLGRTPIHWAALNGHRIVMQDLLNAGADASIIDSKGFNPIALAALGGHQELVNILIKRHKKAASKAIENSKNPLEIALLAAAKGQFSNVVSMLLDAGADPNLMAKIGERDPLWYASANGDLTSVNLLIAAGANVNGGGLIHGTGIQEASANGHIAVVKRLLEGGADVNCRGGQSGTALNAAAFRGHYDVVNLLLLAGAVVAFDDDPWGGAVYMAEPFGHTRVVEILRKYGPKTPEIEIDQEQALGPSGLDGPSSPTSAKPSSGIPRGYKQKFSPLRRISLDAMNQAATELLEAMETGGIEKVRLMVTLGGKLLTSAVTFEDVIFIERFYQMLAMQAGPLQRIKSAELLEMMYGWFENFYQKVNSSNSPHRIYLRGGFREAVGNIFKSFLDGDYATMMRGIITQREIKLQEQIAKRDLKGTKYALEFVAELIRMGVRAPGHAMVARGWTHGYVAAVGALEKRDYPHAFNALLDDMDATHMAGNATRNQKLELVVLYEVARGMKLAAREYPEVARRMRDAVITLLDDVRKGGKLDEVDRVLWERFEELWPQGRAGEVADGVVPEAGSWEVDKVPWWDCYIRVSPQVGPC